jgi:cytoskeletal protein CcmA (bactofilin family)
MEQKPEEENKTPAKPAEQPGGAESVSGMQAETLENSVSQSGNQAAGIQESGSQSAGPKGIKKLIAKLNLYFFAFILALLIAIMALVIGIQRSRQAASPEEVTGQTLSPDDINQLQGNDIKIGDVKQTLNIESNAVFAGKILVQGGTDIAGSLKISGDTSLADLSVSGSGTFQQVQSNELAISGNAGIQGQLTIQKSINVSGGGTFGGPVSIPQLTVENLQLTKDLQFIGHLDAGGGTPGRVNGTALGSGGTSSVSGTDTAGSINISTGSGPPGGCFVTVTFTQAFSTPPHVVVAPIGSDTASLDYYVTRNSTSFSVCATNPTAGRSYVFDYIVID